jgi:3'(2'),5'-bisphosphate nucleotidase
MKPDTPPLSADSLARLEAIARRAGTAILQHYQAQAPVELKLDQSPITAADRAAHAIISDALARWTPAVPVISEEGSLPSPDVRRTWSRFWLVDPLDGTKEFLQRNGEFTVNIALIDEAEPVLGVVFAPALDLLYLAGRGLGAQPGRDPPGHSKPEPDQHEDDADQHKKPCVEGGDHPHCVAAAVNEVGGQQVQAELGELPHAGNDPGPCAERDERGRAFVHAGRNHRG